MKKLIAVLIAGTFIIGTAVAQTPSTTASVVKPVAKKEVMASTTKMKEKKAVTGAKKSEGKKKARKAKKGKAVKAETVAPKTK